VAFVEFPDMWGYRYSPYEIERHAVIAQVAGTLAVTSAVDFGACEGLLAQRLAAVVRERSRPTLRIFVRDSGVPRTYTPVLIDAGFPELDIPIPWWGGRSLRFGFPPR
jgi:hypothetical protein